MPAFISAIHTKKQTLQTKAGNNIKVSGIHVWEYTILNTEWNINLIISKRGRGAREYEKG